MSNVGEIVLLVDDMPQSLGALGLELEADGYTVLVAHSGEAALQRLDLVTPDAILLDALMPGLSGFETCRRIKAEPAWAHIPVIFMTGLSETAHIVEAFDAGGVDYVVKPVRAPEVLARLATHLRNARAVRLAREAIDVGGHGVLLLDAHGRLAWHSPQAKRWLDEFFADSDATARSAWLADRPGAEASAFSTSNSPAATTSTSPAATTGTSTATSTDHPLHTRSLGDRTLCAERLGEVGLGEVMWLLSLRQGSGSSAPARLAAAALTPREAEVLSWIAKGKTNRDVGDILGMSHRTVNKHLEHVFQKLGVETRAAAAALASRAWPDGSVQTG